MLSSARQRLYIVWSYLQPYPLDPSGAVGLFDLQVIGDSFNTIGAHGKPLCQFFFCGRTHCAVQGHDTVVRFNVDV